MASSSSSVPAANPGRDEQLLAVGRRCSHPSCGLVDFLPFKCQHCADSFCADHFKPASHSCPKYDEAKYNRIVPDCPLCNEPVPIPPGEDPNIRMERHLAVDCSVMTGRRSQKASATPKCARPKCGKLLFAQIQCDKCHQKFCPEHRFPSSHNCSPVASTVLPPALPAAAGPQPRGVSASGLAAIRRAAASVKPPAPSSPKKSSAVPPPAKAAAPSLNAVASGSETTSASNSKRPFSKTDRPSTLGINVNNPIDNTHTVLDKPDRHSPKLAPKSPIDFNSFIPRPLFARA